MPCDGSPNGTEFIFGKNQHTCKAQVDKLLHAQIVAEVKTGVKVNVYATTRQVVEPIFSKHFEEDLAREMPVLANVNKVVQRAKAKAFPKETH